MLAVLAIAAAIALSLGRLAIGIPLAAVVIAAIVRMAAHPDAIKDWYAGGVVYLGRDDAYRLEWVDAAIAITRVGSIGLRDGSIELERRLLLGIIPAGTVRRPIGEFYRVDVRADLEEQVRRRGWTGWRQEDRPIRYHYVIDLVDRRGDRLRVLDLAAGINDERAERFVGDLRIRLEKAISSPAPA